MSNQKNSLKISLGILVGTCIAALVNVLFFGKNFVDAITDKRLIALFAGIVLTFLLLRKKKPK